MKTIKTAPPSILNLLQLLLITALLVLFGATGYVLVQVGGDTYQRILTRRDENADARIVTSYITMRARQYDTDGGISIENMEGTKVLVFAEGIGEESYQTRVYHHEGTLYEQYVRADQPFVVGEGFEMVKVNEVDFALEEKDGNKRLALTVRTGEDDRQLREAVINLRAV